MTTKAQLLEHMAGLGLSVETLDHEPVFTVSESADLYAQLPGAHSKNLFLKDKKGRYFLVTARHDTAINLKKIHKLIGAQGRVSFGNAERLMAYLGVEPGSVTPFAVITATDNQVAMILDSALMEHDIGNYHPLENTATTTIHKDDLVAFLKDCNHEPLILDVSENNPDLAEG